MAAGDGLVCKICQIRALNLTSFSPACSIRNAPLPLRRLRLALAFGRREVTFS
jgi:hypothetical protein